MVFSLEAYLGYLTRVDPDSLKQVARRKIGELCFKYGDSGKIVVNEKEVIHIPDGWKFVFQRLNKHGLGSRAYLFFRMGYCDLQTTGLHASNYNRRFLRAGREMRAFYA